MSPFAHERSVIRHFHCAKGGNFSRYFPRSHARAFFINNTRSRKILREIPDYFCESRFPRGLYLNSGHCQFTGKGRLSDRFQNSAYWNGSVSSIVSRNVETNSGTLTPTKTRRKRARAKPLLKKSGDRRQRKNSKHWQFFNLC